MRNILIAILALLLSACSGTEVIINVRDYGAVGDGVTVDTKAIQAAIDAAPENAEVLVPEGEYLISTIYLKSDMTLNIDEGALLKGVEDYREYDSFKTEEDYHMYDSGMGGPNENSAYTPEWSRAMIFCQNLENVVITGEGVIDGCDVFNPNGEESMRGPHTIFIASCYNMVIDEIKITRSGNYAINVLSSDNLVFNDLCISGGWDGIHMRGVEDVVISDCDFKTGDDSIAGGNWTNLLVSDCHINSSCNGFRMFFPSSDVVVNDCEFYGPGVNLHRTSGRTESLYGMVIEPAAWGPAPGDVGDITFNDCEMENLTAPIAVNLSKGNKASTLTVNGLKARGMKEKDVIVHLSQEHFDTIVIKNLDIN